MRKMEQYIRASPAFLSYCFCSWVFTVLTGHLFTAFVGLNLLQSAFTRWRLMENILAKLGCRNS